MCWKTSILHHNHKSVMILASDEEEDGGSLEFSHRLDANQRASIRCLSNRTWLVSCRMEWAFQGVSWSFSVVRDWMGVAWEQGFTGFWRNFYIRIVRDWTRQMNEKADMLLAKKLSHVDIPDTPKGLSLLTSYWCCWHFLMIVSVLA